MREASALRVAIDLLHVPSRVRAIRAAPLPADVDTLLRIAAGDDSAEMEAATLSGRSRDVVRTAAAFFIEQVLLHPEADSYRILGTAPDASNAELRRNMALLLRWLHPDMDRNGERSFFATRVTKAWDNVKTPDRRADHDSAWAASRKNKAHAQARKGSGSRSRRNVPGKFLVRVPSIQQPGILKRALWYLLRRDRH